MNAPIPEPLLAKLRTARHVLVFTGAGVSAESGIPTFRDAQTGLWSRYRAEELATAEAFLLDPDLVWGWYRWRHALARKARPNAAHLAIAALDTRLPECTVVTQNVDDLHERAGSRTVVHLHGSLHAFRCFDCGRSHPHGEAAAHAPPGHEDTAMPEAAPAPARQPPPRCGACGGMVRPGVVWFGEALPDHAWQAALVAAADCDLLFSIGTSALVFPAADLPHRVARRGATVVQVNPDPTPLDTTSHYNLHGPAGQVMPRLLAALG